MIKKVRFGYIIPPFILVPSGILKILHPSPPRVWSVIYGFILILMSLGLVYFLIKDVQKIRSEKL